MPTANEIEMANMAWIKYLQRKHYVDLSKGERVLNKSIVKSQLNPKIENDGCYGRLNNADFREETINPILLPTRKKTVELLIEGHHKKTFHAGVNHTLAQIRMKYWTPKGQAEVKGVLRKCNVCQKYQGGPFKMLSMSPWPNNKVIRSLPFQYTSLDYFGPLYIKCGNHADRRKVWVCLFTCAAVSAIHLEIVADLSAEEFLLALRRSIARRGKPQQIVLDNAPQLKLAKSSVDVALVSAVRDPDVQSHIAEQRITWSFVVQLSPWMGGFYERLVGISKMALRKAIGKTKLTMLQLQTFLTVIEAIINSRPLVYLRENLNDSTALTPSHFQSPNTKTGTPLIINDDNIADPTYFPAKLSSKETFLNTWKKGQNLLEAFWKLRRDDYLLIL